MSFEVKSDANGSRVIEFLDAAGHLVVLRFRGRWLEVSSPAGYSTVNLDEKMAVGLAEIIQHWVVTGELGN